MRSFLLAALFSSFAFFPFLDVLAGYRTLRAANGLYDAGKFMSAAELYMNVIRDEPESRNSPIAAYNLGNTLFRTGRFADAARQFQEIARMPELPETFRADARFNAGNAFVRLALLEGDKKLKMTLLRASLKEYRSALLLNPHDQDSKLNYEITLRLLKNLSSSLPAGGNRSTSAGRSKIRIDVAANLLEQAGKEERSVLQNSYRNTPSKKYVPSNKDW